MNFLARTTLLALSLLAIMSIASADIITFDEFPAMNNNAALTNAYAGIGVTFDTRNSGTWDGIANGDPGNWGVNGTNGPNFLGNNGGTYQESIFLGTGVDDISLDASRTNGSSAGQQLTVDEYNAAAVLVASETLTLGAINTWSTFDLGGLDGTELVLTGSINGFSPYAIDNIQFSSSVPEPTSVILMSTMLLAVAFVARKRIARA